MAEAITVQAEPVEGSELATASAGMTPEQLALRYQQLQELIQRNVLVEGSDYGIIPGTGDKPTLYKAGAEKLAAFFGLSVDMELADKVEIWEPGSAFFYYRYRATATDKWGRYATGEGSANSREAKYRWRTVKERDYSPDIHGPAQKVKKTGQYGDYYVYRVENREPYDLVNTLQKMAQKRAYVQAVLLAVGASAFFTQDVEDLAAAGVIEADERPRRGGGGRTQQQGAAKPRPRQQAAARPASEPAAATGPAKINAQQMSTLAEELKKLGITDKELGRSLLQAVVGRSYADTRDLTRAEGARAIEYLEKLGTALAAAGIPADQRLTYISAVVEGGEAPSTDPVALKTDYSAWANAGLLDDVEGSDE